MLYWFSWGAAVAELAFPNATFTAIQAALLFVIVAQRNGDGLASFAGVDTCRVQAEVNGPNEEAFQRCTAGDH